MQFYFIIVDICGKNYFVLSRHTLFGLTFDQLEETESGISELIEVILAVLLLGNSLQYSRLSYVRFKMVCLYRVDAKVMGMDLWVFRS